MTAHPQSGKEAVALFHDAETMEAAIDELLTSGFDRAEISLVASDEAVQEKLGHRYERAEQVEDDQTVPRRAYVERESLGDAQGVLIGALGYVGATVAAGAVVASGGALAAVIGAAAAAGTGGGLIGSLLANQLGKARAEEIQAQIDRGGLLLWVRAWDDAQEKKAVDILKRHSADDVHLHDLDRTAHED
jgi:outer membrane lipoprotein SlyB